MGTFSGLAAELNVITRILPRWRQGVIWSQRRRCGDGAEVRGMRWITLKIEESHKPKNEGIL